MERQYSLFEKRGFRYHRITKQAYTLSVARIIFQDSLLALGLGKGEQTFERSLRPVEDAWAGQQRVYRPPVERETQGVDGVAYMPAAQRAATSATTFVKERLRRTEGPRRSEVVEGDDGPLDLRRK